ncbi:MAG: hypothetical protein KAU21_15125, partial [Gammaproteobacteria bacterium]|nr:hypothetical protein [Gammaproteobacteria bacterium]
MLFKNSKKFIQLFMSAFILLALQACSSSETESYQFEYLSDIDQVYQGKSTFTIKVTDKNSGVPAAGLDLNVNPVMTMDDGTVHNTPVDSVTDNDDGTYGVTVYYLMASMMGDWDLKVSVGNEEAHFYPVVKMSMGDTARVVLRGKASGTDMIADTLGDLPRPYFIFKNSMTGMEGNHTFNFFLAAREDMMSHPAVYLNTTLNPGTGYELWVNTIVVE